MYNWGGVGGMGKAGISVHSHSILQEIDCIKGKMASKAILSHQNTIILTGDPSVKIGDGF